VEQVNSAKGVAMATCDLLIKNVKVVNHDGESATPLDIAVTDGIVTEISAGLDESNAKKVIDGTGRVAYPGAVDVHQHWGIYNTLDQDTVTESKASAQGGVTTAITYMRTGQYYLNKGGSYLDFFPEVLALSANRAYIDYGFHLAPMTKQHIAEIPEIITQFGVSSFKIFMFYGSHGLHGRSNDQSSFLMTPPDERYDIAHFEFVMRGVQAAREKFGERADSISLGLHCETAEIMSAYTKIVEDEGKYSGLEAYHHSRPPHSEGLAITIASYLAYETELPNINLLHLTSRKAAEAAMLMQSTFPHINFRREVTVGHLLADIENSKGVGGKVNPPLRPRADVESLWTHLKAGHLDWVVSDHACCKEELKFGNPKEDVFLAKSGFGGAEYLLPGIITEGLQRGLTRPDIAKLTSFTPAQRYGLKKKGSLAVGFEADIALVDESVNYTVRAADSESTQEYTPFEGFTLTAKVTDTFVRGNHVLENGKIVGNAIGKYQFRA
jgi:allantoinase